QREEVEGQVERGFDLERQNQMKEHQKAIKKLEKDLMNEQRIAKRNLEEKQKQEVKDFKEKQKHLLKEQKQKNKNDKSLSSSDRKKNEKYEADLQILNELRFTHKQGMDKQRAHH